MVGVVFIICCLLMGEWESFLALVEFMIGFQYFIC